MESNKRKLMSRHVKSFCCLTRKGGRFHCFACLHTREIYPANTTDKLRRVASTERYRWVKGCGNLSIGYARLYFVGEDMSLQLSLEALLC